MLALTLAREWAALHSPALGLQHPLALPWDPQGLKVLAYPGTGSTALSLSCRHHRLSIIGLLLGRDGVSSTIPSSQASRPRRPSLAHRPCLAPLASHSPPADRTVRAGLRCGLLQPPKQPYTPTLVAAWLGGGRHSPLVLAALGHLVGPARETGAGTERQPGHQEQSESRLVGQILTPGPGGPGGPGSPTLPWGPGKPCNGKSHVREGTWHRAGTAGTLAVPARGCAAAGLGSSGGGGGLDGLGGPGRCWWGGCRCLPGCWSQAPLDRPGKRVLASVPPPRPTRHRNHGYVPALPQGRLDLGGDPA